MSPLLGCSEPYACGFRCSVFIWPTRGPSGMERALGEYWIHGWMDRCVDGWVNSVLAQLAKARALWGGWVSGSAPCRTLGHSSSTVWYHLSPDLSPLSDRWVLPEDGSRSESALCPPQGQQEVPGRVCRGLKAPTRCVVGGLFGRWAPWSVGGSAPGNSTRVRPTRPLSTGHE